MSLDLAVTDWNMIYFSFARLLNIDNRFAVASSDDRNKELEPEYGMYYVNNTGRIFSNKRPRGIEICPGGGGCGIFIRGEIFSPKIARNDKL